MPGSDQPPTTDDHWPDHLPVQRVRVARPTDRFDAVVRFYTEDLALPLIDRIAGKNGYDLAFVGLPGLPYHLEFTHHDAGSPGPAPTRDNLLVLYLTDRDAVAAAGQRMRNAGHVPVPSENPYWDELGGLTFEDPDGWRVVLTVPPGS